MNDASWEMEGSNGKLSGTFFRVWKQAQPGPGPDCAFGKHHNINIIFQYPKKILLQSHVLYLFSQIH